MLVLKDISIRLLALFTLICYINTITCTGTPGPKGLAAIITNSKFVKLKPATAKCSTLVATIMREIADAPYSSRHCERGLFSKFYNFLSQIYVDLVSRVSYLIFYSLQPLIILNIPRQFIATKLTILPGYYNFLFRLKPF